MHCTALLPHYQRFYSGVLSFMMVCGETCTDFLVSTTDFFSCSNILNIPFVQSNIKPSQSLQKRADSYFGICCQFFSDCSFVVLFILVLCSSRCSCAISGIVSSMFVSLVTSLLLLCACVLQLPSWEPGHLRPEQIIVAHTERSK